MRNIYYMTQAIFQTYKSFLVTLYVFNDLATLIFAFS